MTSPSQTKSRVVMYAFCEDCGKECHPCDYCQKSVSYGPGCYCKDCDRDFGYAGQMFYPVYPTVKPCFICFPCQEEREQHVKEPKALKEGFVSMDEILKGQPVTGKQFFAAYRDTINYGDEEEIGNNPKTMSYKMLVKAYEEACEDRTNLYRKLKRDEELLKAMEDWAKKLSDELRKR